MNFKLHVCLCMCVCVCVCVCVPAYISCVCLLAVGLADALSKLLLGAGTQAAMMGEEWA